jgi:hypothetical protein
VTEIKQLESEIISIDMDIKRVEDNLGLYKQRKAFLDELAISAGKKTLNPTKSSGQLGNSAHSKSIYRKTSQKKK